MGAGLVRASSEEPAICPRRSKRSSDHVGSIHIFSRTGACSVTGVQDWGDIAQQSAGCTVRMGVLLAATCDTTFW